MSSVKCHTPMNVKLHWAQCVKSNYNRMATYIGSHLTREPTSSPVLTKWRMWELILATNFGSPLQMVTKVDSQILVTKFGFVPDWLVQGIAWSLKLSTAKPLPNPVLMKILYPVPYGVIGA